MKKLILLFSCLSIFISISACEDNSSSNIPVSQTPSAQYEAFIGKSKNDLIDAIQNAPPTDINGLSELDFFFEPRNIPEGTELFEIRVKPFYCQLHYRIKENLEDGNIVLLFEWYRTMVAGDIENNLDRYGSNVKQNKKDKNYYIEELTAEETQTTKNVYWSEDGYCFHAVVPRGTTDDEIMQMCKAKKVNIKDE